jgi:hypothetical protein
MWHVQIFNIFQAQNVVLSANEDLKMGEIKKTLEISTIDKVRSNPELPLPGKNSYFLGSE